MGRLSLFSLALLLLSACAPPAPVTEGPFAAVTPLQAREPDFAGERVRWGGSIISVTPGREETCFEILSRPLSWQARPERTDTTDGRFVACAPGFYDPAGYPTEREVTVTGKIGAPTLLRVGDFDYRAPRIQADTIYLWPERVAQTAPHYYDPFWDPWYPWRFRPRHWGPWGPPYWW
jgi:outer membrane lipoprotein